MQQRPIPWLSCKVFFSFIAKSVAMFEKRNQQIISKKLFYSRLAKHLLVAAGLVVVSLSIGTVGYQTLENMGWVDAFYNASMILTGMGPVSPLRHDASKVFASLYAVYGGIVILAITAIVLAPLAHRLLHWFHLKEND